MPEKFEKILPIFSSFHKESGMESVSVESVAIILIIRPSVTTLTSGRFPLISILHRTSLKSAVTYLYS
jgi:hypothetical protein